MIFTPNPDTVLTNTTLQAGDLIRIHPKGSVLIFRQSDEVVDGKPVFLPLQFTETEASIEFHSGSNLGIDHAYAWFIARAIASIAGLFVEDSYETYTPEPSGDTFYQFPVTSESPVFVGKDSPDDH